MSDNYYNLRSPASSSAAASSGAMPPVADAPMSVVAIIGLVAPFLCCWPVGIVLSIIGFIQTKDGARRGRGIAIAGLIVNVVFALFTITAVALAPEPVEASMINKDNAHEMADQLEREVDNDVTR